MRNKETVELKHRPRLIIVYGLAIHVLLLFSVFDIYFTSPLDMNLEPVKSTKNAPANRLFLILVDGLRAESIFYKYEDRAPFLKTVTQNTGSWGVVHAKVPTESRTGLTAILAGVYEDPSAIFSGWKRYPLEIDTVLNRSRHVWYFGSPGEIEQQPNIDMKMFEADLESFVSGDTFLFDKWTFEQTETFLKENITKCLKNCEHFFKNETIFFLYLLGIDSGGHESKPDSPQYVHNIAYVDRSIEKLSKLVASTFLDNKSTFVLTADHGMTNEGSHGGGSQLETEVPLIAWGAGIQTHIPISLPINQIDIAPLLASLLGLEIPTNSLGVTPTHFLNLSKKHLAEIKYSNVLQLLNKFKAKKSKIEKNALFAVPFQQITRYKLDAIMNALNIAKYSHKHHFSIDESDRLIYLLLQGIKYYDTYYKKPLLVAISVGLLEWIVYLLCFSTIEKSKTPLTKNQKRMIILLNGTSLALCFIQSFPFLFYLYFCFPLIMYSIILPYIPTLKDLILKSKSKTCCPWWKRVCGYILGIELIVFGFSYRALFTCLTLLLLFWILSLIKSSAFVGFKISWVLLSAILSCFPLLPIMIGWFNFATYSLGLLIWFAFLNITFNVLYFYDCLFPREVLLFCSQFLFSVLSFIHVVLLHYEIISKNSSFRKLSWIYFMVPIILIAFSKRKIPVRLASIFFGFTPYYLLVTFNFEAVFLATYAATISFYLFIEVRLRYDDCYLLFSSNFASYETKEISTSDTFRRAFFFISFSALGFFGIGNVASLSSFNVSWMRAFLTTNFVILKATLIGFKLSVPFLFTCCIFRAINHVAQESFLKTFCVILAMTDFMILQLIFLINNSGSWLEIGTSLSNFLIAEVFIVVLALLYGVAYLLTTANIKIFEIHFLNKPVHIV